MTDNNTSSTTFSVKDQKKRYDTAESVNDLVAAIRATQYETIILGGNTYCVDAIKLVAAALAEQKSLTTLDIGDIFTTRTREDIAVAMGYIRDALRGHQSLTSLIVEDNAFGPAPLRAFVDLLPSLPALSYYNTNNTGLSPEGGRIYANALLGRLVEQLPETGLSIPESECKPMKLRSFIAGRSRIESEGIKYLADAFERMGSLVELRLPQNGIKGEGMKRLAQALKANPDLEILDLYDNNIGNPEAADTLIEIIGGTLRKLTVVNLGDCMLEAEKTSKLIQALSTHEDLEELNLSFSEIDDEMCEQLIECIVKRAKKLKRLEVDGNRFSKKMISKLTEALKEVGKEDALGSLEDNECTESEEETEGSEEEEEEEETPKKSTESKEASDVDQLAKSLKDMKI